MSDINNYDPGLINPETDTVQAVRYWINQANTYWQDEADRFEVEIAELESEVEKLQAENAQLKARLAGTKKMPETDPAASRDCELRQHDHDA